MGETEAVGGADERKAGLDSLASEIVGLRQENAALRTELERLSKIVVVDVPGLAEAHSRSWTPSLLSAEPDLRSRASPPPRPLEGRASVGIYPLLDSDRTAFVAADFDKGSWRLDALAYMDAPSARRYPRRWKSPGPPGAPTSGRSSQSPSGPQ